MLIKQQNNSTLPAVGYSSIDIHAQVIIFFILIDSDNGAQVGYHRVPTFKSECALKKQMKMAALFYFVKGKEVEGWQYINTSHIRRIIGSLISRLLAFSSHKHERHCCAA